MSSAAGPGKHRAGSAGGIHPTLLDGGETSGEKMDSLVKMFRDLLKLFKK